MFGEFEFTGPVFLIRISFFFANFKFFSVAVLAEDASVADYFLLLDLHCFGAFELFGAAICSTDATADLLDWHFLGDILDFSPLVANSDDEKALALPQMVAQISF